MGNPNAPIDDLAYVVDYIRAVGRDHHARGRRWRSPSGCHRRRGRARCCWCPTPRPATTPSAGSSCPSRPDRRYTGQTASLARVIMEGRDLDTALPRMRRDDPAIWLFTSGSTGRAKAAMHTHRDFAFNTEVYAKQTVGYRSDDVTISVPRLFFGYATGTNLLFPFAVGATVGLFSERPTAGVAVPGDRALPADDRHQRADDARQAARSRRRAACARRARARSVVRPLPPLGGRGAAARAARRRFLARFGGEVYDGIGSAEMFHIYCLEPAGRRRSPARSAARSRATSSRSSPRTPTGPGAPPLAAGRDRRAVGQGRLGRAGLLPGSRQELEDVPRPLVPHRRSVPHRRATATCGSAGAPTICSRSAGVFVAPLEVEDCLLAHAAVELASR